MTRNLTPIEIEEFLPLRDSVIVHKMHFGERLSSSGIIIPNDDMKNSGIRPRWARIYAVGPEQTDLKVGQWVYIAHGRWTRGVKIEDENGDHVVRKVDNNDILLVSDDDIIEDVTLGSKAV